MTPKQRKIWENRMIQREIRMLNFYRAPLANNDPPDGSFLMGAFLHGWDSAMRASRKNPKSKPTK